MFDAALPCLPVRSYRVQLVDDHHMLRLGLTALAASSGRHDIHWLESANLANALAQHDKNTPIDLVLLDLNLPDSQGLQGLRRFLWAFPRARIAIFSATSDDFVVRQAMSLGAVGFLGKSASAEATLELVESLLLGQHLPADAAATASSAPTALAAGGAAATATRPGRLAARTAVLNATELRVLELLLEGLSNQEIAAECQLALGTIKNAVSSILLAMDVQSRSHLARVFR